MRHMLCPAELRFAGSSRPSECCLSVFVLIVLQIHPISWTISRLLADEGEVEYMICDSVDLTEKSARESATAK